MGARYGWLLGVALFLFGTASLGADQKEPLAQQPTISKTTIVFQSGGYLWSVPREGGEARQLTTAGHEDSPQFSPDGTQIAFTGQYDGNVDVYVMPAAGGTPKRLTWHPGQDIALGWTPDGKRILFSSNKQACDSRKFELYLINVDGTGLEQVTNFGGFTAFPEFSPDGKSIVFASDKDGKTPYEFNIFTAEWREKK